MPYRSTRGLRTSPSPTARPPRPTLCPPSPRVARGRLPLLLLPPPRSRRRQTPPSLPRVTEDTIIQTHSATTSALQRSCSASRTSHPTCPLAPAACKAKRRSMSQRRSSTHGARRGISATRRVEPNRRRRRWRLCPKAGRERGSTSRRIRDICTTSTRRATASDLQNRNIGCPQNQKGSTRARAVSVIRTAGADGPAHGGRSTKLLADRLADLVAGQG